MKYFTSFNELVILSMFIHICVILTQSEIYPENIL